MQKGQDIGQSIKIKDKARDYGSEDFVLEKSIFSNIFERDIRRVFIYKKAERLAKAIHMITPAFSESVSLKNRIDAIAVGIVDSAILTSLAARTALSRELLALSSILSIARTGGILSAMNTEIITREAHLLLQEVADYEEPRLFLDEAQTLSSISKISISKRSIYKKTEKTLLHKDISRNNIKDKTKDRIKHSIKDSEKVSEKDNIKNIKDKMQESKSAPIKERSEAVLAIIKSKGKATIKDISTMIRDVSEKTIQRELLSLIAHNIISKNGERRWSTYSIL